MTRTPGADVQAIQRVADEYEATMDRYLAYQDWLYAEDRLPPYEKKLYLRRKRQSLLWKLLLEDAVESFPAFGADPVAELKRAVAEAAGVKPAFSDGEVDRVLALGALVPERTPEGTRFRWAE